jgi:hypothetical protein
MTSRTEPPFEETLEILGECIRVCTWCADEDIRLADATMVECARLCLDCADVCEACVSLLARDSSFYRQFCGVCAEICEACAAECTKHAHHVHCRICAEICTRCAEQCRLLAA